MFGVHWGACLGEFSIELYDKIDYVWSPAAGKFPNLMYSQFEGLESNDLAIFAVTTWNEVCQSCKARKTATNSA